MVLHLGHISTDLAFVVSMFSIVHSVQGGDYESKT